MVYLTEFLHNVEYLQAFTISNVFPERCGYTNLLGIECELATEPLFKLLVEHQSTVASLNVTLSATLFYSTHLNKNGRD